MESDNHWIELNCTVQKSQHYLYFWFEQPLPPIHLYSYVCCRYDVMMGLEHQLTKCFVPRYNFTLGEASASGSGRENTTCSSGGDDEDMVSNAKLLLSHLIL